MDTMSEMKNPDNYYRAMLVVNVALVDKSNVAPLWGGGKGDQPNKGG